MCFLHFPYHMNYASNSPLRIPMFLSSLHRSLSNNNALRGTADVAMTRKTLGPSTTSASAFPPMASRKECLGSKAVAKTSEGIMANSVAHEVSSPFSIWKKDKPVRRSFPGPASCWMGTINSWALVPLCLSRQIMTSAVELGESLRQLIN